MLRYVSGNKMSHALKYGKFLLGNNKKPIINYISENANENNKLKVYNEYSNLLENINSKYLVALKLSSFNFDKVLIRRLVNNYKSKDISLIIDAEDNKNINNYRQLTNSLMMTMNDDNYSIIKTYQMYRKDSLEELRDDMQMMKNHGKFFAPKLVRGAYWNSEYKEGHLYTNKEETDQNYFEGILQCYNKRNQYNLLATHNLESIDCAIKMNRRHNIFKVAHLMGMNERNMRKYEGRINIGTYVPYGPYREMIPYLGRRLYENIDSIKYILK